MSQPLTILNEYLDQVILYMNDHKELTGGSKKRLKDIIGEIINSGNPNEKDLELYSLFKELDKEMNLLDPDKRFINFADWHKENKGFVIPTKEKNRAIAILKRLEAY